MRHLAAPPGDRKQRVDAAIGASIGVPNEAGLAHGAVHGDERRHGIGGAILRGERKLRVDRGTRAADSWLSVATRAAVQIHSRPHAVVHCFGFAEVRCPRFEVFKLLAGQSRQRLAGRSTAANAGIFRGRPAWTL